MSEQNYKEFFEEAMNLIHEELKASGNENEFILNFNISYIEDTITEIKVSVPSKFLWDRMVKKGNISVIESKINELTGQSITLTPSFNFMPQIPSQKSAPATLKTNEDVQNSQKTVSPPPRKPSFFTDIVTEENSSIQNGSDSQDDYSLIPKAPAQPMLIPHPQLIEDYTFDNFVPGDNSDYAYKACLAAAENPGSKNYNPILLYGPSGVGKTHLMVSIGNYIYEHSPSKKICYTTTESFMNDFTAALRQKTTDKFIKKYRSFDVFLLDDIQFLEGKEKLTDEVFFTFEAIYKRKGQIVFTSDRSIKFIKGIEERIGSRFKYGPNIDLKAPSFETRLAIIDKKLEVQGKIIPQDVKEFIAKNFQSNVRELEGALSRMIGYADLMHKDLTLEIAKEQLNDSINPTNSGIVSVETIQKAVSEFYNVSVDDLKSASRKKTVAVPRHIAIYLCRELTEYSLDEIGEEFGGRDHSTVISSISNIEDKLKTGDIAISDIVKALTKQIVKGN
ncbi:MAG: chromosomal replication initiator protein DnaA [Treponema sp.]|nr:chromosomal replication initiator protein DnaA [Treponema sp.]